MSELRAHPCQSSCCMVQNSTSIVSASLARPGLLPRLPCAPPSPALMPRAGRFRCDRSLLPASVADAAAAAARKVIGSPPPPPPPRSQPREVR